MQSWKGILKLIDLWLMRHDSYGAPEGAQGHNIARNVAVLSDLPIQVGGTTVNRYCSSGLQTVAMAATQVQSGFSDCTIAGGVESISTTQGHGNMAACM